jgi:hypothetical protein
VQRHSGREFTASTQRIIEDLNLRVDNARALGREAVWSWQRQFYAGDDETNDSCKGKRDPKIGISDLKTVSDQT